MSTLTDLLRDGSALSAYQECGLEYFIMNGDFESIEDENFKLLVQEYKQVYNKLSQYIESNLPEEEVD